MKHNKDKEYNYLTYKIEIDPTPEVEIMLRKNCEYRHFLYNKCVEVVRDIEEKEDTILIDWYDLLHLIRDKYEKTKKNPNSGQERPLFLEDYDYYFRGISECVVDDIATRCRNIVTNRKNGILGGHLNFLKFNNDQLTFRFKSKGHVYKNTGNFTGSRLLLYNNPYLIGLKINNLQGILPIYLKESINDFNFKLQDVKEIVIKHHNEKWFLCLVVDCGEILSHIKVSHKRKKVCGIDLGETNPVVMYDGKVVVIPKHLQFPLEKVKKVEIRIKRLQRVLDRKVKGSINYSKVLAKLRKAWEHLVNIKKDWHFKLAHWIVTHYKNIVVDEFDHYVIGVENDYPTRKRKNVNHSIYRKGMNAFFRRLHYMSLKYGTNYFNALPDTTNTCSHCNHINSTKLLIDATHNERIFTCESCNLILDRDINASINCYKQYELLKACDAMI